VEAHLSTLINVAPSLSRTDFLARLKGLNLYVTGVAQSARLLRGHALAGNVNNVLGDLVLARATAYENLCTDIAHRAQLPWPRTALQGPSETVLATTARTWRVALASARQQPGLHHLHDFSTSGVLVSTTISRALAAPSLRVHRGLGIMAVWMKPVPLPAAIGQVLLPPTHHLTIGVSVKNFEMVHQPSAVTVTVTPQGRRGQRVSARQTATLAGTSGFAFVLPNLNVSPGEHAIVRVSVGGAPAAAGYTVTRVYHLMVAAS
jgi:hypothetical protein